jgi:site-specific recombinase XerD
MNATPVVRSEVPPDVLDDVAELLRGSRSERTWRAYESDLRAWRGWCDDHDVDPLPATPETLVWWLQSQAAQGYAVATIARRLVTIRQAHRKVGHPCPTDDQAVRTVWQGVRRRLGTAQLQVAPVTIETLRRLVSTCDDDLAGRRDRALLVVGFAGGFRRAEVAALEVADVEEHDDGLVVTLRRSKTDQEGAGRRLGLPYGSNPETCPVRTLRAWLEGSAIEAGPIFRPVTMHGRIGDRAMSGRAVAEVVKRRARAAGLDPTRYSGHSLRAGLVTSAALAGASEIMIARQTGHRSMAVLRRYVREADMFRANAAAAVGL